MDYIMDYTMDYNCQYSIRKTFSRSRKTRLTSKCRIFLHTHLQYLFCLLLVLFLLNINPFSWASLKAISIQYIPYSIWFMGPSIFLRIFNLILLFYCWKCYIDMYHIHADFQLLIYSVSISSKEILHKIFSVVGFSNLANCNQDL